MVLDASFLNTQQYKVRNKGKVEQSREMSSAILGVVAIEKRAFWSPLTTVAKFTFTYMIFQILKTIQVKPDALQFGLSFATGLKNQNIVNLIKLIDRHNDYN